MSITTKTGDKGMTGIKQKRLKKTSDLIELIGTIDEAQAHFILAYSLSQTKDEGFKEKVEDLNIINAILSGYKSYDDFPKSKISEMEKEIEKRNEAFDDFVYPFDDTYRAQVNLLRTVVRRAERYALRALSHDTDSLILVYLNRLSDYVFTYMKYVK